MSRAYTTCLKCGQEYDITADEPHPCLLLPQTNADRIRAMSDEELAEMLSAQIDVEYCSGCLCNSMCGGGQCKSELLAWLKREVSE